MAFHRSLQFLHRSGWEFWLPLPLIAVLFWTAGNFVTEKGLNQSSDSANRLQADLQTEGQLAVNVIMVNAEIDPARNTTKVVIRINDARQKNKTYEVPSTQVDQVEKFIAEDLNVPVELVRQAASYRVKSSGN
ncbi:MAG TPA: hypothetical protein V6D29_05030 [Leptolyngbyaceae cyanobacterium]